MQRAGVCAVDEKGIVARDPPELFGRARHDRRLASEAISDGLTNKTGCTLRNGRRRPEHHVSALDVGVYVAAAGVDKSGREIAHPQPVLDSNVEPTQQGEVHTRRFRHPVHLVDRLEPEERRLIGIGQHIKEAVGALPHIPDPLSKIGEEPFTAELFARRVKDDSFEMPSVSASSPF